MPGASDGLISGGIVSAALRHLRRQGREELERQFRATEPNLEYAICRLAVDALADMEGVPEEVHTAVYDATWRAALLTMEAYRIAYYQLWAKSAHGSVLEKLDPELARRAERNDPPDDGDNEVSG
jgi:hypothetical protein